MKGTQEKSQHVQSAIQSNNRAYQDKMTEL